MQRSCPLPTFPPNLQHHLLQAFSVCQSWCQSNLPALCCVFTALGATTDSLGMPSCGPAALGPSSQTSLVAAAASAGPIPSSLATPENSVFSGAPLFGRSTPMDGGAPRDQPMPTRRLELSGAVYPLYSQMDARKRSFSIWVEGPGLPAVDELITLGFFYAGLILSYWLSAGRLCECWAVWWQVCREFDVGLCARVMFLCKELLACMFM